VWTDPPRRAARLRAFAFASAAAALWLAAVTAAAPEPLPARRVVIITASSADARLAAARDAIAFWNGTLSDLGVTERLSETGLIVNAPVSRPLETYTRQIWRLAGRSVPPEWDPPPPPALLEIDADIVVFFSKQQIFSFAWPFANRTRFFIGISTDADPPLDQPNVTRNVIAHEFGHTFGLEHNGNTATLMCGPCERLVYRSEQPTFFPLSPAEHQRLRAREPSQ
jgi:hypothetical protein